MYCLVLCSELRVYLWDCGLLQLYPHILRIQSYLPINFFIHIVNSHHTASYAVISISIIWGSVIAASLSALMSIIWSNHLISLFLRLLHSLHPDRYWSSATTNWERSLPLSPSPAWPLYFVSTWITTSSSTSTRERCSSCQASGSCACRGTGCISYTLTPCAHCLCWTHFTSPHSGEL